MIREYSPKIVLVTVIEISEDADVDLEDVDEILSVTEHLKKTLEILYSNPRTERWPLKKKIHQSFKVCGRHKSCS